MCEPSPGDMQFADLLRDPLTRLVMRSDGVTKREMVLLGKRVSTALAARRNPDRSHRGFPVGQQRSPTFDPRE